MKNLSLKLAVVGTLGLVATQASAAFVALPTTGFSVTGGTSAYTIFNPTGNFGAAPDTAPTVSGFDTGHAIPASNDVTKAPAPYGSFTLAGSATGSIVVNNTYTNSTNVTIGSWNNRVWRSPAKNQCVYGYQIVNTLSSSADYRPSVAGTQYIEINDIAYGGWGTNAISAAYFRPPNGSTSVVYRAGRTFTSVQHRSAGSGSGRESVAAEGFVAQPKTTPPNTSSINGLDTTYGYAFIGGKIYVATAPTAAQQSASINSNWVDFTFAVRTLDEAGNTYGSSPWVYVYSTACPQGNSFTLTTTPNAVRLRQTYRNLNGEIVSSDARFIEIALPAIIPPGGNVAPTPVTPY